MNRGYTPLVYMGVSSQVACFVHFTSRDNERSVCSQHSWQSILSQRHFLTVLGLNVDQRIFLRLFRAQKEEWQPEQIDGKGNIEYEDMPKLEDGREGNCKYISGNPVIKREEGLQCYGDMSLEHVSVMQTPVRSSDNQRSVYKNSANNITSKNNLQQHQQQPSDALLNSPISYRQHKQLHIPKSASKSAMKKSRRSLSGGSGEMFFGLLQQYSDENNTPLLPSKTYKAREMTPDHRGSSQQRQPAITNEEVLAQKPVEKLVFNNNNKFSPRYSGNKPVVHTSPSIGLMYTTPHIGSNGQNGGSGSNSVPIVPSVKNRRSMSLSDNTNNALANNGSASLVYSDGSGATASYYTPIATRDLQPQVVETQTAKERLSRMHRQFDSLKELHPETIAVKKGSPFLDDTYVMELSHL